MTTRVVMLLFSAIAACAVGSKEVAANQPELKCIIQMQAWCIGNSSSFIERIDLSYGGRWIIGNGVDDQPPGEVIEPDSCSKEPSDMAKLLARVEDNGSGQTEFLIRLAADGSCDLKVLIPIDNNSIKGLVEQNLRVCSTNECKGPLFGQILAQKLNGDP